MNQALVVLCLAATASALRVGNLDSLEGPTKPHKRQPGALNNTIDLFFKKVEKSANASARKLQTWGTPQKANASLHANASSKPKQVSAASPWPSTNLLVHTTPRNCKTGEWKWTKRNSSALREEALPVKKIFYLNVDGQKEREQHMLAELHQKAPGVPVERFGAFKAGRLSKKWKSEEFKKVASLYSKARYTSWLKTDPNKEVFAAIHITNYQVMEKIMKDDPDGESPYMILEDDSTIVPNWQTKLKTILENTPKEWDILRIGYWGYARCGDAENNYAYAIQPPARDPKAGVTGPNFYSGNTGYIVRPKSIPRILDIMRESSIASIENVLMYPHKFPDGSDQQILSYAVAPDHMLVQPSGDNFASSHI